MAENKHNYKLSVVVPIYNAEKYIERCARSLFEQTLDKIQYIFVDDCTPDNSVFVLQEVLNDYPNRKKDVIIVRHNFNTGQSGARHDGIKKATGKFIIHCDSDDYIDKDAYKEMYETIINYSADIVVCDIVQEYGNYSETLNYNNQYEDHKLMFDCIAPISVLYCSMCNRMVRKELAQTVLPFDGINMWDDVGMAIRLRFLSRKTVVINKSFYHYTCNNKNSTTKRTDLNKLYEMVKCVNELQEFFVHKNVFKKY